MIDYKSLDNRELLKLCKAGDEAAGMELYRRQYQG